MAMAPSGSTAAATSSASLASFSCYLRPREKLWRKSNGYLLKTTKWGHWMHRLVADALHFPTMLRTPINKLHWMVFVQQNDMNVIICIILFSISWIWIDFVHFHVKFQRKVIAWMLRIVIPTDLIVNFLC